MDPHAVGAIVHEGMTVIAMTGGPLFLALLVSGLFIGVLQASTQVNDPAVGFLPRLAVAALMCLLLGGWMMERLAAFFIACVQRMGGG